MEPTVSGILRFFGPLFLSDERASCLDSRDHSAFLSWPSAALCTRYFTVLSFSGLVVVFVDRLGVVSCVVFIAQNGQRCSSSPQRGALSFCECSIFSNVILTSDPRLAPRIIIMPLTDFCPRHYGERCICHRVEKVAMKGEDCQLVRSSIVAEVYQ